MAEQFDIIIVGGGPAGLTAAIYARRAGRTVLLLEKEGFGGQIASAPKVENYPGFAAISGAELADRLYTQAENLGARIELEEVISVTDGEVKTVTTDYGTYTCTALILATGMKRRTLGLDGEEGLRGVSFCAVCDGAFYQGRDVAVCGGGNTALQDARFLSELCRSVTVIHRRGEFRGDPMLVEELENTANVKLMTFAQVTELISEAGALTGLKIADTRTGDITFLSVDGLFEAVGQLPEQTISTSLGLAGEDGFLPCGEDCVTAIPGIFAAGDCRSKEVRQLTTACADGACAAVAAAAYCRKG